MMQSDEPPRENPILSAYEKFQAETPLVTRYTLTTLLLSYVLSFFWDPTIALSAIPIFILKLQLYRLITSPLICTSGLNLIFAFFSMTYYGKKLEYSMGSTSFAMLILIFGGLTNLIYIHVCFAACLITDNASWLTSPSHGFWMVLLGLISLEASMAPPGSTRRLLTLEIPNLYYPLVLLGIFALLSGGGDGIPLSYFISTALGYGLGLGKLDRLKLGHERRTRWEASILRNFTSRQGWVVGPSGHEWYVENNNTNANANASTSSGGNQDQYTPTIFRRGNTSEVQSIPSFTGTKGQVLGTSSSSNSATGGPIRRVGVPSPAPTQTVDRSALLAAAERRAATATSNSQEMSEEP